MLFLLPAAETKGSEHAALVGDISLSVDRVVRKGVADHVANPLAKLVVNTARQVVAEPLQVCVLWAGFDVKCVGCCGCCAGVGVSVLCRCGCGCGCVGVCAVYVCCGCPLGAVGVLWVLWACCGCCRSAVAAVRAVLRGCLGAKVI